MIYDPFLSKQKSFFAINLKVLTTMKTCNQNNHHPQGAFTIILYEENHFYLFSSFFPGNPKQKKDEIPHNKNFNIKIYSSYFFSSFPLIFVCVYFWFLFIFTFNSCEISLDAFKSFYIVVIMDQVLQKRWKFLGNSSFKLDGRLCWEFADTFMNLEFLWCLKLKKNNLSK